MDKYYYAARTCAQCGDSNPKASQNWLKIVEIQLRLLGIPEALKVDVMVPFLEDKPKDGGKHSYQPWQLLEQSLGSSLETLFLSNLPSRGPTAEAYWVWESLANSIHVRSGAHFPVQCPRNMCPDNYGKWSFEIAHNRIQSALAVYQPTNFADLIGCSHPSRNWYRLKRMRIQEQAPFNGKSS